jgi:hypothetical protein
MALVTASAVGLESRWLKASPPCPTLNLHLKLKVLPAP